MGINKTNLIPIGSHHSFRPWGLNLSSLKRGDSWFTDKNLFPSQRRGTEVLISTSLKSGSSYPIFNFLYFYFLCFTNLKILKFNQTKFIFYFRVLGFCNWSWKSSNKNLKWIQLFFLQIHPLPKGKGFSLGD